MACSIYLSGRGISTRIWGTRLDPGTGGASHHLGLACGGGVCHADRCSSVFPRTLGHRRRSHTPASGSKDVARSLPRRPANALRPRLVALETFTERGALHLGRGDRAGNRHRSMIAGFIGWTTFMVDRSDRERKRLEEALQLRQEHLDRLLSTWRNRKPKPGYASWSRWGSPEPCF